MELKPLKKEPKHYQNYDDFIFGFIKKVIKGLITLIDIFKYAGVSLKRSKICFILQLLTIGELIAIFIYLIPSIIPESSFNQPVYFAVGLYAIHLLLDTIFDVNFFQMLFSSAYRVTVLNLLSASTLIMYFLFSIHSESISNYLGKKLYKVNYER